MKVRPLPPLEVGQAYRAAEFLYFEYCPPLEDEKPTILRLHLSNSTSIDLPTSPVELKRLLVVLSEAFSQHAVEHVRKRGWLDRPSI